MHSIGMKVAIGDLRCYIDSRTSTANVTSDRLIRLYTKGKQKPRYFVARNKSVPTGSFPVALSKVSRSGGKRKMSGSRFDLLMQEIFNQKQLMDELIEENRDLRHQLTDLREGRGIYLAINGKQFALNAEPLVASPQIDPPSPDFLATNQTPPGMALNELPMGGIPETPRPNIDEFEQIPGYFNHEDEEEIAIFTPTFLDEMLIDELAAKTTTQMRAWKSPVTRKLPPIDEEEKAILRKELIGSFLLE